MDNVPGGPARQLEYQKAYAILDDLQRDGKIESKAADEAKEKFYKLHEALCENMENETQLLKKARSLGKELQNELLKLEKTQQQSAENETLLKELNHHVEAIKAENEKITDRRDRLKAEKISLDRQKLDLKGEIAEQVQQKKDEYRPRIDNTINMRRIMEKQYEHDEHELKTGAERIAQLKERIARHADEKLKAKQEFDDQQGKYLTEKEEPIRIEKTNANLRQAVEHLKSEVKGLEADRDDLVEKTVDQEATLKRNKQVIDDLKQKGKEHEKAKESLTEEHMRIKRRMDELRRKKEEIDSESVKLDADIKAYESEKQRLMERQSKTRLANNQELKKVSKLTKEVTELDNEIREHEAKLASINKETAELDAIDKELEKDTQKLLDEQHIFVGQLVKRGLDSNKAELERRNKRDYNAALQGQVKTMKETENKMKIEKKFLSTIKDKMARTASQAHAQAQETQNELRVREIQIVDLSKKQQETEFRLNTLQALHEDTKNMRNKYVAQIQSSSQDLAEMNERIKILQNEVEILRNESADKDVRLEKLRKEVAQQVQERDQSRADLNKKELVQRDKLRIINQRINEGDKHNLIINSLQKEMNSLIFKYETACESRNYMGIQLIDKNDELCILYEKSNIQETILKNGEQAIRQKEEEMRMFKLELKERQRQLKVIKDLVPEVPQLAKQVIALKEKVAAEKAKVEQLSSIQENPDKHPRKIDLPGEDADSDTLDAKIQVLEERLNNKKESLLEKELVYEEVTNLAEKLRAKALDGRKSTLEIAEKINEYKARTAELSRKMLATVSELSMFQSKALKLQQEKEEKDQLLESAIQRLENGMPPTETCEGEWEKKVRDAERKEQDAMERMRRKQLEMLPANGIKSHAPARKHSYVPPDIQIPKPYFKFQPFMGAQPSANMRHISKPKKIEIEY